jgi:hypothetical protein
MSATSLRVTGKVVRETVSPGSKSEQATVVLKTSAGRSYILRRQGAAAFGDTGFDPMVGKSITAQGVEVGSTFIVRDWITLD